MSGGLSQSGLGPLRSASSSSLRSQRTLVPRSQQTLVARVWSGEPPPRGNSLTFAAPQEDLGEPDHEQGHSSLDLEIFNSKSPGTSPRKIRKRRLRSSNALGAIEQAPDFLADMGEDEVVHMSDLIADCRKAPRRAAMDYVPLPCGDPSRVAERQAGQRRVSKALRAEVMKLLQSLPFQCLTVGSILANAVVIGLETDLPSPLWDTVEFAFLQVFSAEVAMRIFVFGFRAYLCGERQPSVPLTRKQLRERKEKRGANKENESDVMWNIFDFSIVVFGWFMVVLEPWAGKSQKKTSSDATLLRAIRLLRLLRILRVIRVVRFLKQLYLLAYGFLEGISAVFWVAVLATGLMYLCAIVLVRTYRTSEDDPDYEFFHAHFPNIPGAMFTLFETMASPNLGTYKVVFGHSPFLAVFMVLFVIFGSLGMNGLLTGVISESIMEKNQARIESERQERECQRKNLQETCGKLFDEITNSDQYMYVAQFREQIEDIKALVADAGAAVATEDLESMFLALDYDDRGKLDKVDFVNGMLELCDEVRPMSIMEIQGQISSCQTDIEHLNSKVEKLLTLQKQQQQQAATSPMPRSRSPVMIKEQNRRRSSTPEQLVCPGAEELRAIGSLQSYLGQQAHKGDGGAAVEKLLSLNQSLARLLQENSELFRESLVKEEPKMKRSSWKAEPLLPKLAPPEPPKNGCCLGAAKPKVIGSFLCA